MRHPGKHLAPRQQAVAVAVCTVAAVVCAGGVAATAAAAPSAAAATHSGGRPAARTAAAQGGTLILTVVPDLRDLSVDEARQALTTVGLVLGPVGATVDCYHLGTVSSQTPAADATALYGSPVAVTVGVRPKPPSVCP
jgi:PASTA domain-containing protein